MSASVAAAAGTQAEQRLDGSTEGEADAGLLCAICMHCVHHVQEGADDVTALLVAAGAATAASQRRGSEGACQPAAGPAMAVAIGLSSMQLAHVAT